MANLRCRGLRRSRAYYRRHRRSHARNRLIEDRLAGHRRVVMSEETRVAYALRRARHAVDVARRDRRERIAAGSDLPRIVRRALSAVQTAEEIEIVLEGTLGLRRVAAAREDRRIRITIAAETVDAHAVAARSRRESRRSRWTEIDQRHTTVDRIARLRDRIRAVAGKARYRAVTPLLGFSSKKVRQQVARPRLQKTIHAINQSSRDDS